MNPGRLSLFQAGLVIARRDFFAVLFSRAFFFFLLGPLFPVIVAFMAGSIGQRVTEEANRPVIGVAMEAKDTRAMLAAHARLAPRLGNMLPALEKTESVPDDPAEALGQAGPHFIAVVGGTPAAPILAGPKDTIELWQGPVSMLAAEALSTQERDFPAVTLSATATSGAKQRTGQIRTAQAAQTMLFLLTMLLAGMVLSNLVEEKGNKVIEILAAAIPMDAVFFGKLFAMLGVSIVGIAVWSVFGGGVLMLAGQNLPDLPDPAVGWPVFFVFGTAYFAMAYLLLGSIFLAIGAVAATVRDVQTLSMPVTMLQLLVFFFAGYALSQPGSLIELVAMVFPLSSPFAMLARAARLPDLWPHLVALAWQAVAVTLFVRAGATLFRHRVMKSAGARGKASQSRKWWHRLPGRQAVADRSPVHR